MAMIFKGRNRVTQPYTYRASAKKGHGGIDIVRDDGRVRVAHVVDNVPVDAGGLLGLLELDLDILGQVLVARVAESLGVDEPVEEDVVALEAREEIDERVLDPLELEDLVVADGLLQLGLGVHDLHVDILKVFKIPDGCG